MSVHLSGLVCFYSSTGCVLKVCVFAFTALIILCSGRAGGRVVKQRMRELFHIKDIRLCLR